MKVKVLLISPFSKEKVGGIGTWTKLVLDYSKTRNGVEIVYQNTVHALPKRWALSNSFTHFLIGSLDSLLIILKLLYNLCFKRPNIVHYTSSAASALYKDRIVAFIVTRIFRKKIIVHWRFGRIPSIFMNRGREYKNFIKVLNLVSFSIVLDKASYKMIKDAKYRVVLIPNPISPTIQQITEGLTVKNDSIKREVGTILFVGHMLKTKGIYELVEACIKCPHVKKLIMVGPFFDEGIRSKIKELSNERDNGEWLSLEGEKPRETVWDYYKTCSVFCLPSYTEGFPNVILEAMAFACPIVASNVGAIPEMLSGDCGEIVEPKAVEPLEAVLEKLVLDPTRARVMGEKAHGKVFKEYTVEKVYSEYEKLWKNI